MKRQINRAAWVLLALGNFLAPDLKAACTYDVSPTSRNHGYGTATNTVVMTVAPGCVWTIANTNAWITFPGGTNGTGNATNTYYVAANPTYFPRTGIVIIGGLPFSVQQAGIPCSYSLSPGTRTHGYGTANNQFAVQANTNCSWSVSNSTTWIIMTGATNGFGTNNNVTYTVLANQTPVQRTGTLAIADQTFIMIQHAAPCLYELTPTNRVHGPTNSSGVVTNTTSANCSWSVDNTNTWITITANSNGLGTGTFSYSVAANPTGLARSGLVMVWDETFTVFQQAAQCSYSIVPSSSSPTADPETNIVTVSTLIGCAWNVVNTNSWISASPTNGSGGGTVACVIAANLGSLGRTGVVTIAGKSFTVRQDAGGCTYRLSPTNRVHGYGATTNSIDITTLSLCAWNVVNTNSWLTFSLPTNGTGNGTVTYSMPLNAGNNDRSGVVTIGGAPFSITQHGLGCAVNLSPATRNHGYTAASNSLTVGIAGGCSWDVINTNPWITIVQNSNGVGSNFVGYTVAQNPTANSRVGYITVEEGVTTLTQAGAPCSFSIAPSNSMHTAAQETNIVSVSTLVGCTWTVNNTNSWITILSGTNGTGSTSVVFQVAPNLNSGPRSATITIAGINYVISQDGATCVYKLSPTTRTHGYAAATNTVSVTVSNPCPWSASSTNSWITVLLGASGAGTGTVTYAVSANSLSSTDRIGSLMVADQFLTITQHGVAPTCNYVCTPTTRAHGYGAASNSFAVTVANGCPWSVGNTNPWIAITTGTNGNGNGTVGYTVDDNTNLVDRIGFLTVDVQTFVITQRAAVCTFNLTPDTRNHGSPAATNTVSVATTAGCGWPVSTSNGWITILSGPSGSGPGTVTYSVASNNTGASRSGSIAIGDQTFVIKQLTNFCAYTLTPATRTHGYGAATNSFLVSGTNGCSWSVANPNAWIHLTGGASGVNNGTVSYTVDANTNLVDRIGLLSVNGEVFTMTQRATVCTFDLTPTTRSHGYGATTNSVGVSTTPNCVWPVSTADSWISILSGASGTGTGTVVYSVASNINVTPRSGAILIGDQNFVINQSAYLCSYKLSPTNRTHGFGANTGLVSVTAGPGCTWTVVNTNDWISIVSGGSGTGNGTFTYTIPANFGTSTRSGAVTLADQVLTLAQLPATGGFSFEVVNLTGNGDITVRLAGGPPGIWELQSSSDLSPTNWVKIANLTNNTGRVEYLIPSPGGNKRFYRAVLP